MNDKQKQIVKLLWDFQSLREVHLKQICDCDETDINFLIANKAIIRDKTTKILKYNNNKGVNFRNVVAFDVVMEYLDRNPKIKKGKHPVNVTVETNKYSYDIIAVKEIEQETLFERIDEVSKSDRVIIIIETKKEYQEKFVNTKRPCYICTYPLLKIVDGIN